MGAESMRRFWDNYMDADERQQYQQCDDEIGTNLQTVAPDLQDVVLVWDQYIPQCGGAL